MFTLHTQQTAPLESREMLQAILTKFKFVPNQDKILAAAPNIYKAYNNSFDLFLAKSSLGLIEGQVVLMAVSYYNESPYCIAVHSWGMEVTGVNPLVIEALRAGTAIPDERLQKLRDFTIHIMLNKGQSSQESIENFLESGFTQQNIIEIIGGIATKTLANYTNLIASTPLDEIMEKYKWVSPYHTL
jgi:uncharacterized peroxidase-related enzyme